jgi:mycothiol synthase
VFSLQTYQPEDLAAVIAFLRLELPTEAITEAGFARRVLLDPNFVPEGAFVARGNGGEIRGFLLALTRRRPLEEGRSDVDRGWITLFAVARTARRQGIGTALFDAAETWLRAQGCTSFWISPYAPGYWTPGVDEAAYPEALAFLHRRSYETVSRPLSMDASLVGGWHVPDWVHAREAALKTQGVALETFSPRWILTLTDFLRQEFPGDWQRYLRETMGEIVAGRRPAEELLLAVEGRRILGFAQSEGERFGPFGVAAAERGRGVGAVLLFRVLDGMRALGRHNAWFFWTDDATAERVYRTAGFRETRRYAILRKS